jgi:hypothetical protein
MVKLLVREELKTQSGVLRRIARTNRTDDQSVVGASMVARARALMKWHGRGRLRTAASPRMVFLNLPD